MRPRQIQRRHLTHRSRGEKRLRKTAYGFKGSAQKFFDRLFDAQAPGRRSRELAGFKP